VRRALAFLALAVAVVALVVARRDERDRGVAAGTAREGRVVRVVDGDTIHVRVDGRDERVRYIGIDTPEDVKPDTPVQCYARAAAAANGRLVGGREVRLVFDAEPRDRYGRLLAYVFRGDDGLFVNAELVRDGFARTLTIPPNVRYARRFAGLVTQARRAGRGLWRACPS
jgi:micrococcal nuclease